MLSAYLLRANTKTHPPHSAVFDQDDRVVVGFKNRVDVVEIACLPGRRVGCDGSVCHGDLGGVYTFWGE